MLGYSLSLLDAASQQQHHAPAAACRQLECTPWHGPSLLLLMAAGVIIPPQACTVKLGPDAIGTGKGACVGAARESQTWDRQQARVSERAAGAGRPGARSPCLAITTVVAQVVSRANSSRQVRARLLDYLQQRHPKYKTHSTFG
jgi:hypothetical protein